MPISYQRNLARAVGFCEIEEAEKLLSWLISKRTPRIDLMKMSHLHTAVAQVLIAYPIEVIAWPEDRERCSFYQSILKR